MIKPKVSLTKSRLLSSLVEVHHLVDLDLDPNISLTTLADLDHLGHRLDMACHLLASEHQAALVRHVDFSWL